MFADTDGVDATVYEHLMTPLVTVQRSGAGGVGATAWYFWRRCNGLRTFDETGGIGATTGGDGARPVASVQRSASAGVNTKRPTRGECPVRVTPKATVCSDFTVLSRLWLFPLRRQAI